MFDNDILEAIKKFLQENVSASLKLEAPSEENCIDGEYRLVNPAVYIGWIPPKNYLNEYGYDVPSILVMLDGGEDDTNDGSLDIRLGIVTYDPGYTTEQGMSPNSLGYKDLLNVIGKIRLELGKRFTIEEKTSVIKPIKWGLYEEQKYPYWHGWLSFQVSILEIPFHPEGDKFL